MAQEIYNEGRVVGLSAYEIFVKQVIANGVDPSDIPTESQWLTSMIGSGASMVLKLNAGTTSGVHDYELPSGSNLTVAGVVIGSPFIGDGEFESGWAKKITSYGALIENDNIASPTSTNVPSTTYKSKEYRVSFISCYFKLGRKKEGDEGMKEEKEERGKRGKKGWKKKGEREKQNKNSL